MPKLAHKLLVDYHHMRTGMPFYAEKHSIRKFLDLCKHHLKHNSGSPTCRVALRAMQNKHEGTKGKLALASKTRVWINRIVHNYDF